MSITKNVARVGNFTSSEIIHLTTNGKAKGTFGKPFHTYIEECNWERLLNRSIDREQNAQALSWGHLCERRVFDILPIEYRLHSNESIEHPTIKCWAGSPDVTKEMSAVLLVGDVKAPITLKSFCRLVEPLRLGLNGMDAINHIRENHSDGEKYYWQLISNAIITGSDICQLIVYCPYLSELPKIRELAREQPGYKYNWIINGSDEELPHIVDGGIYQNLNFIEFPVTLYDREILTDRVLAAEKLLIQRPDVYTKLLQ